VCGDILQSNEEETARQRLRMDTLVKKGQAKAILRVVRCMRPVGNIGRMHRIPSEGGAVFPGAGSLNVQSLDIRIGECVVLVQESEGATRT